jgi:hypothetical protein
MLFFCILLVVLCIENFIKSQDMDINTIHVFVISK